MSPGSIKQMRDMEIVLKAIKETSNEKRQAVLRELFCKKEEGTKASTFSSLSGVQRGLLRKECIERLGGLRRRNDSGILRDLFCFKTSSHTSSKPIHPVILDLIAELKRRCTVEPGIFRREGDRSEYLKLVRDIVNGKPVDFTHHSLRVLASALKSYIRDYLDGFFDAAHLDLVVRRFHRAGAQNSQQFFKYLIFSLNPMHRKCLIALQDLLMEVSNKIESTKMSLESLCNIISLTMTPQKIFQKIEIIPILVNFYKELLKCDMENLEEIHELIEDISEFEGVQ